MNQGVPVLVAWPVFRNPSNHEEFLQRLQPSSSHLGDLKRSQTTTPCFQNGLAGVLRGIEIPIEDVENFLADLFKEGYLYRSLNSYRSAISALHSKVDGYSIGQHPLITRMLKGVFNERPPVAKYSAFWDVGVVLRYLKGLGMNDTLSLRLLTINRSC